MQKIDYKMNRNYSTFIVISNIISNNIFCFIEIAEGTFSECSFSDTNTSKDE